MLLLTSFSDYKQARGFPVMAVFIIGIVGWAILLKVPATTTSSGYSARYFGTICIVTAGYTNIPLIISWQVSSIPSESPVLTRIGGQQPPRISASDRSRFPQFYRPMSLASRCLLVPLQRRSSVCQRRFYQHRLPSSRVRYRSRHDHVFQIGEQEKGQEGGEPRDEWSPD